jgi:hypothetical protein
MDKTRLNQYLEAGLNLAEDFFSLDANSQDYFLEISRVRKIPFFAVYAMWDEHAKATEGDITHHDFEGTYQEFVGDDFGFAPGDVVIESTVDDNPREAVIADIYDYGHYIAERDGDRLLIGSTKLTRKPETVGMSEDEMRECYKLIQGHTIARREGFPEAGQIEVTWQGGFKATFSSIEEVGRLFPLRGDSIVTLEELYAIAGISSE